MNWVGIKIGLTNCLHKVSSSKCAFSLGNQDFVRRWCMRMVSTRPASLGIVPHEPSADCGKDSSEAVKSRRDPIQPVAAATVRPLRSIPPYYKINDIFCKQRWFGRTVSNILETEFKDVSLHQHELEMQNGRIILIKDRGSRKPETQIKGSHVENAIVENGDILQYLVHLHEPPIAEPGSVEIIHEDNDILVVNKPSGVPVHPSGKYFKNSLLYILAKDLDTKLYACHRLDRLTSGVLILTKNPRAANQFAALLRQRTVSKQYIAKVNGLFPEYVAEKCFM